jgi:hypothetical protein
MTMWLLTVLSLIGVVLNIKKKRSCFVIWAFTNASWAVIDYQAGLHAQAALFAVYFCLAIWGLVEWRVNA